MEVKIQLPSTLFDKYDLLDIFNRFIDETKDKVDRLEIQIFDIGPLGKAVSGKTYLVKGKG